MRTDAALLRVYADTRAQDAFAELVERHLDGVYSTALRRVGGDTHLAQDVCQQVFVALARKAGALAEHPALASWLFIAARNEAANVVRAERRRKARENEALVMENLEARDAADVDWSRVSPVLDAIIDSLREPDRTAILLRFVERRAFADIGVALNVSEDAARMRVDRALDRLRAMLARRGISSSSAALSAALAQHAVVAAPTSLAAQIIGSASIATAGSGLALACAGALEFMSTAKFVGAVATLLALLGGFVTSRHALQASRETEASLAAAVERQVARAARLEEAERRLRGARNQATQLQEQLETARKSAFETAAASHNRARVPAPPDESPAGDPRLAGDAFMARHPEVKGAVNAYARARVDFRFSELYRKLGLTAAQIEEFRELMSAGFGMGASGAKGESMSLTSGDWSSIPGRNARLKAMLGTQGMQVFQEYAVWTEPARQVAAQVAGALWHTDTPLAPGQADQLAAIMNDSRAANVSGRGPIDRFDWDAIATKAATILSAPQLAALEDQRARDRFNSAMNRPPTTASAGAGGGSAPVK
jgi:RNA polymerase sigma factor (sigma-70 family)